MLPGLLLQGQQQTCFTVLVSGQIASYREPLLGIPLVILMLAVV